MHDLKANFDIIFDKLKPLTANIFNSAGNLPRPGPVPKFSDLQVISLCLTAEYLSIDSENNLYARLIADYAQDFPNLIERSNFNRRRRNLFAVLESVRQQLSKRLNQGEDFFMLDSKPLPICCFSRAVGCKTCQEFDWALPSFGYCASQKMPYFGYKFHAVVSCQGVIEQCDLSSAYHHDIDYLSDVGLSMDNCKIIGDKAYLSAVKKQVLQQNNHITLLTPMRNNQKNYQKFPAIFRRLRKRIETVFSQLDGQFNLKNNLAKTFTGLRVRVLSKVTAFTLIQFINKFVFFREIDHVKIPIY